MVALHQTQYAVKVNINDWMGISDNSKTIFLPYEKNEMKYLDMKAKTFWKFSKCVLFQRSTFNLEKRRSILDKLCTTLIPALG